MERENKKHVINRNKLNKIKNAVNIPQIKYSDQKRNCQHRTIEYTETKKSHKT